MSENADRIALAFHELIVGQPSADVAAVGRAVVRGFLGEARRNRLVACEIAEALGLRGIVIVSVEDVGVYIEKTYRDDDPIAEKTIETIHDALWTVMTEKIGKPIQ